MKRRILLVSFLMLSCMSYAQLIDEIRPSINARQFFSTVSSETSLREGQVAVNLPLFSLPGKGFDIPISLLFSTEGITHESEASHIGLGWSLMAGGVITATIRGRDDNKAKNYDEISWHFNFNYLQDLRDAQAQNPYNTNLFDLAMWRVMSVDPEPDSYQYSFLGYSGDINFSFFNSDRTKRVLSLTPDSDFKIEKTTQGYKIIADNGTEYIFECKESNQINTELYTTSWFLSEIKSVQGGHAKLSYVDETFYDYLNSLGTSYSLIKSKRLIRIDTDYGYVNFKPLSSSNGTREQITGIELYNDKNILIKGYKLKSDGVFGNGNPYYAGDNGGANARFKLDRIIEYNCFNECLPPYKFEYDYYFSRSKSSYKAGSTDNSTVNTWAQNPTVVAVVDRNVEGYPACWMECPNSPEENSVGFSMHYDKLDETYQDYFCISKITFPTGGSESYFYEKHDYSYVSGSGDIADPISPSFNIMGRRLTTKIITEPNGSIQYLEYKYGLHDENHQLIIDNPMMPRYKSSGMLIAPSIHTSVIYKPVTDYERRHRLQATVYTTDKPQNSFPGAPVCYKEVEEILRSGNTGEVIGRNVYYFDGRTARPPVNYIYTNYKYDGGLIGTANILVPLQNKIFGKMERYPYRMTNYNEFNMTYLAYPVGNFTVYDTSKGKPVKVVTLDSQGRVVRIIENIYQCASSFWRIGWKIAPFDDGEGRNRYLISMQSYMNYYPQLAKRITHNYFPDLGTSSTEEETYSYAGTTRPISSTVKLNSDESIESDYVYPDKIRFDTQTSLSPQASAIRKMIDMNMINNPIQVTKKRGGKYIEGIYTTYKQISNGNIVVDSIFNLESQLETALLNPMVNTSGKVVRHSNFSAEKKHTAYDESLNPVDIKSRDDVSTTLRWGYGGRYVIARIANYTNSQLENNATLNNLIKSLDGYTEITSANMASLISCNEAIRNSLPETAMITTYTYAPMVGITSVTDPQGITVFYDYDLFGRLIQTWRIKDGNKEVLEFNHHHYRNQ